MKTIAEQKFVFHNFKTVVKDGKKRRNSKLIDAPDAYQAKTAFLKSLKKDQRTDKALVQVRTPEEHRAYVKSVNKAAIDNAEHKRKMERSLKVDREAHASAAATYASWGPWKGN